MKEMGKVMKLGTAESITIYGILTQYSGRHWYSWILKIRASW